MFHPLICPQAMANTTQLSLLERVRRSPEDPGWQEFVAVYSPYIERYLGRLGVRAGDIGDIRQEVMQVVVGELPGFDHNRRKGAFRAWLRNVIVNRLRSFRRSLAHQPQGVGGPDYTQLAERLEDPNSDVSRAWDEEHNRHVIQSLLEVVRPRFQDQTMTAFRRVVLNEQPASTVASDLGMTVNAVRIAQARVLQSLRQLGKGLVD